MGHYVIKMPDIGEGIAEVELIGWKVEIGGTVAEDEVIAEVMTDKAMVEIPSPVAGTVLRLGGEPGEMMAVGSELIRLEVEGAGNAETTEPVIEPATPAPPVPEPAAPEIPAAPLVPESVATDTTTTSDTQTTGTVMPGPAQRAGRSPPARGNASQTPVAHPLASPAVRRRAWDMGIELRYVPPSGPGGRIIHADLDAYLASGGQAQQPASQNGYPRRTGQQQFPVIGLRRKIAQKMQQAWTNIPHITYIEEIDVTELEHLRTTLNQRLGPERGKLTVLPLLARALILALREFPQMNARFDDAEGSVTRYEGVHLGIATQSEAGLSVPVIQHAESLTLWQTAAEISRLSGSVRQGHATREELTGSTITISSLGPLGGIAATPIINHPEIAIIAVNRIIERPMLQGGQVAARKLMNLSSSFDHRIIDGMEAAAFVQAIRRYLETPALLFVEA